MAPRKAPTRRKKGTGRVYEYPKGTGQWWAQLPERHGKTGPKWRVKDEATGKSELADKLVQLEQGIKVYARGDTFGDWMDFWVDTVEASGDKPTTCEGYRQVIRLYIHSQPISRIRLADLQKADLRAWVIGITKVISEHTGKLLAPRTIRNAYARMHTALVFAQDENRITWSPPKSIKLPNVTTRGKRALTVDECNQFLAIVAKHRLAVLYKLAMVTGMRQAELIGLLWEMVDWEHSVINLTSQLKWLRASKRWNRQPLKNNQWRTIELDPILLDELRAHYERILREQAKTEDWQDNGLVFPSEKGTPLTARNLVRHFEGVLVAAQITKVTFHELRHTAGSLILQDGTTMTIVSGLLGHSSVGVTEKVYAHSYADDRRAAVASTTKRLRRVAGGEE